MRICVTLMSYLHITLREGRPRNNRSVCKFQVCTRPCAQMEMMMMNSENVPLKHVVRIVVITTLQE